MKITKAGVVDFKEVYCNENKLIATIFKDHFSRHLDEPILDVGAGTGDISCTAFPNKKVIHLDVLDYSTYSIPTCHFRQIGDFFEIDFKGEEIGTIIFCHVMQFIDDDIVRLNDQLVNVNPKNIVMVMNQNNDFMGKLIEWFKINTKAANPEVAIQNFPPGYKLEKEIKFQAELVCNSFDTLANQVCYLMDTDLSLTLREKLCIYLQAQLDEPKFTINESITLHVKV